MQAHTNIKQSRKHVFKIKNLYLRTYLGQIVTISNTIRNHALYNLILIKITVARFVSK